MGGGLRHDKARVGEHLERYLYICIYDIHMYITYIYLICRSEFPFHEIMLQERARLSRVPQGWHRRAVDQHVRPCPGTQFTCFASTREQMLSQKLAQK